MIVLEHLATSISHGFKRPVTISTGDFLIFTIGLLLLVISHFSDWHANSGTTLITSARLIKNTIREGRNKNSLRILFLPRKPDQLKCITECYRFVISMNLTIMVGMPYTGRVIEATCPFLETYHHY